MRGGARLRTFGGLLLALSLWFACGVSAAAAAPPPNDDFADAQLLSGALPIEVSGSNVGATAENGEPGRIPASAGHSVWYRWEATSTEVVTVATCGSEILPILAVYVGSSLGALTQVPAARWEWSGCPSGGGAQATFRAIGGKTYSVQVDGNNYHEPSQPPVSGEGEIDLQVRHQPPPANDDMAAAQTLQAGAASVPVSNLGATKEPGEPSHRGDPGGASVWFKWTAPRTGGAYVQLDGGQVGHQGLVAAYTGAAVESLSPVPGIESWGTGTFAFPVVAGATYRIAVDGEYDPATETAFMDERGISLSMYPGNDDFGSPGGFPSASSFGWTFGVFGLGNVGATKQPGEPDHAGNRGGSSVWFAWGASESGSVGLNVCGASFHTLLAVYTGSSLTDLTPVAASSDPQSPSCALGGPYEVRFNVDAGTTYRIAVDGYEGAWGSFGLELHTSKERLASSQAPGPARAGHRPGTRIVAGPVDRRRRVAVFHLRSSEPDSTFLCRLDSHPFASCQSTVVYRKLKPGRHVLRSRAVNSSGERDATPAVLHFKIAGGDQVGMAGR